jgi:hypothetical protein
LGRLGNFTEKSQPSASLYSGAWGGVVSEKWADSIQVHPPTLPKKKLHVCSNFNPKKTPFFFFFSVGLICRQVPNFLETLEKTISMHV